MDSKDVHPEKMDPEWFQELVRRAFERENEKLLREGLNPDDAMERAMWYVFDLRNNLTDLYQAGRPNLQPEDFQ